MYLLSANMTYKQLSMTVEFSLMGHKKKQVLFCWLKNGNFKLAGHTLRSSASDSKKDAGHTLWEAFLGAATSLFVLDCLCFMEAIFGFNFWETASTCHWGEAKNCFIFDINFWLRVWSPSLLFFAHVAGNSHLAWGRSGRIGAEWVVTALVRF